MALEISPAGLEYGDVEIGGPAAHRTVRAINTGPGPVEFAIGCDKKEFSVAPAGPVRLRKVGGFVDLDVTFAPRRPGSLHAAVTLSTRYLNFAVGLKGAGVRAPKARP